MRGTAFHSAFGTAEELAACDEVDLAVVGQGGPPPRADDRCAERGKAALRPAPRQTGESLPMTTDDLIAVKRPREDRYVPPFRASTYDRPNGRKLIAESVTLTSLCRPCALRP